MLQLHTAGYHQLHLETSTYFGPLYNSVDPPLDGIDLDCADLNINSYVLLATACS